MFNKAAVIALLSLMCFGLLIIIFPLAFLIFFESTPQIIIPEVQNGTISTTPVFAASLDTNMILPYPHPYVTMGLRDAETNGYIHSMSGSGWALRGVQTLAPEEALRPGQKIRLGVTLCRGVIKYFDIYCKDFDYYFTVGDIYQLPSAKEQEVIDEMRNFGIPTYLKNSSPYKEFGVPLYLRNSSNDST